MKIQDDDDLYVEIGAARVLVKALTRGIYEINGHEDEHGWFIPDDTTKNRHIFFDQFAEWMELIRVIFDKLDEADAYLADKLDVSCNKKASSAPTDQSEALNANTAPVSGCCKQYSMAREEKQGKD